MKLFCNGAVPRLPSIGDRVRELISYGMDRDGEKRMQPGTVAYVNERHGYYLVLFDIGIRECYRLGGDEE